MSLTDDVGTIYRMYEPNVAALVDAGEQLRADIGRVDLYQHSHAAMWASHVDDVLYSLRRAGWTVEPPSGEA